MPGPIPPPPVDVQLEEESPFLEQRLRRGIDRVARWNPWGYACSYRLGFGYVWIPLYEPPGGRMP